MAENPLSEINHENTISNLKDSLASDPQNASLLFALGRAYFLRKDFHRASQALNNAIKINQNSEDICDLLGKTLWELKLFEMAAQCFVHAHYLSPNNIHYPMNAALCYISIQDYKSAIKLLNESIAMDEKDSRIYNRLGICHTNTLEFDKAIGNYERSIQLNPRNIDAQFNLGQLYRQQKQYKDAIICFERTLEIDPDYIKAITTQFHALHFMCEWDKYKSVEARYNKYIKRNPAAIEKCIETPFTNVTRCMDEEMNYAVAKAAANYVKKQISSPDKLCGLLAPKQPGKKIRVGYVSNDFYPHPTSHLIRKLFQCHDSELFSINTYSYSPESDSFYRKDIERFSDQFIDIKELTDLEAAKKIANDKIDILVDLKGHTTGNRLGIFAYHPAPIQVTWLGFPGTTGSDFIDYLITDNVVTPESSQQFYSEQFAYMPDCYQVNDDEQIVSDKKYNRSDWNLPEAGIVFCCFNQSYKIDPVIFNCWMRILERVPDSCLWLLHHDDIADKNLKKAAEACGINDDRIIITKFMPKAEHLARLQLADIMMDTRIYNGHTTTSDALWAGTPVVTLKGKHFASRVAASILTAIGLESLITHTIQDYENRIVYLANNPEELQNIKQQLQENRHSTPLFNTAEFARNLEILYQKIYDAVLSGNPQNIGL